jgi:hypothetical protein
MRPECAHRQAMKAELAHLDHRVVGAWQKEAEEERPTGPSNSHLSRLTLEVTPLPTKSSFIH